MVFTVLNWLIIVIIFGGIGFGISKLIKKIIGYEIIGLHGKIMCGLVFCTVYAEAFSTVYKLGQLAFIILTIIMFVCLLYSGGEIYDYLYELRKRMSNNRSRAYGLLLVFAASLFFSSFVASRAPLGFDALNYHIPDIRWLEEYGAVKGAGNLASWFAYNSSFHCLQALFSFVWAGGTSYHSMNGFVLMFMLVHSVASLSIFTEKHFGLSDILKLMFVWILFGCNTWGIQLPLASPGTDFLPICLVGYIFIEWCSLNESGTQEDEPYGLLSILGIFAISAKLSSAVLVLFAIKPLTGYIQKKDFKHIIQFVCLGIIVMIPFLVRNVIISGYLLYPVASIDLFDFDWEMPKSVVVYDSVVIKLFARNQGDYRCVNITKSFWEWFKDWQRTLLSQHSITAMTNLIIAPFVMMISVYRMIRGRKDSYDNIVYFEAAFGFLFLIFTAPSLRFGVIWFYILPVVCVYWICDTISSGGTITKWIDEIIKKMRNYKGYLTVAAILIIYCAVNIQWFTLQNHFDAKVVPKDYEHIKDEDYTYEISGYKFYYTNSDVGKPRTSKGAEGLIGYDGFPGSCNLAYLKRMELRGRDLSDGFRAKPEFRNVPYYSNGVEMDDETVIMLGLDKYYN